MTPLWAWGRWVVTRSIQAPLMWWPMRTFTRRTRSSSTTGSSGSVPRRTAALWNASSTGRKPLTSIAGETAGKGRSPASELCGLFASFCQVIISGVCTGTWCALLWPSQYCSWESSYTRADVISRIIPQTTLKAGVRSEETIPARKWSLESFGKEITVLFRVQLK